MNTKRISDRALSIIEQYKNVPYFNNKSTGRRAGMRVEVGKGSPGEIYDELESISRLNKIDFKSLDSFQQKKLMLENNIGIDCSGFAYYLLNEESITRGKGSIDKHLHFIKFSNPLRKFIAKLRPEKNTDVITFADNKNSHVVLIKDVGVGDIITMIGERNHILIIHQIEYQNFSPVTIHYVHATTWPTDGETGHGIHEGKIEVINLEKPIIEQRWIELDQVGEENYTYVRAKRSKTELRRLRSFE